MKAMTRRCCVDKNGLSWFDRHFRDIPDNAFKMTAFLTNIVVIGQFLSNCRELCTKLGRLPPPLVPIDHPEGRRLIKWSDSLSGSLSPRASSAHPS